MKMKQKKNDQWVITRTKYIFFHDYWCPEWKGWVSRNHYLYSKCLMKYWICLREFNNLNVNDGEI
jgi:hypothetical protein